MESFADEHAEALLQQFSNDAARLSQAERAAVRTAIESADASRVDPNASEDPCQ